jgi:hypothetical protein
MNPNAPTNSVAMQIAFLLFTLLLALSGSLQTQLFVVVSQKLLLSLLR